MSEVETFSRTGFYEQTTAFSHGKFRYALRAVPGISTLEAVFENDTITLMVPLKDAADWAQNSKIGFEDTMKLPGSESLSLLLEKDFACLDEREEDQADNYPNPNAK